MAGGDNSHEFQFQIVIIHNETSESQQQRRRSARPLFYYHPRSTVHALSVFASLLFTSKWLSIYYYDCIPRSALDIIAQTMRGEKCEEKKTPFKNPSHYHRHFIFPFVVLQLLLAIVLESRCWLMVGEPLLASAERC